ncbi:MAG: F0F1 ATP synthase subunit B [Ktedonobacteraceae bacterium]|nr:F0F1 ATP synthase subunit B [Ktedonobacteraceae bacterium]
MAVIAQSLVFAAGGGGISDGLGINGWAFLSQLVSFLIVFFALWRWLLPILLKTMNNRQNIIREGVENAERATTALAEADAQASQILTNARRQGQDIVERAQKIAEQEASRIRDEAYAQAEQIAQQNIARIHQEANRARAELSRQVVNLSIDAAGRVVGRSVNSDDNRRLVEEFVIASNDQARNN